VTGGDEAGEASGTEATGAVEDAGRSMAGPRAGARAAAARIRTAGAWADLPEANRAARIGVVLGTGLGGLADGLAGPLVIPAADTGWLRRSSATGHAGRLVCGTVDGVPLAMLQGRVHGYEGFPPEALTRGVELLAALGATTLLLTNASGGLRPDMTAGDLVIVTDHLDLVRRPWGEGLGTAAPPLRPRAARLYDAQLAEAALTATRRAGVPSRRGVYALLSGPSYETRAEYRLLRSVGADVVGMSTVPEVVAAWHLGLRVVVCSVVTNVARPDAPARTDAEDVCQMAASAATGVAAILRALVASERHSGRRDLVGAAR
jgi:purine-nucleoside phosphorylase